jgi:hypothetical protein
MRPTTPVHRRPGCGLLGRGAVAGVAALAVLGGVAAASPPPARAQAVGEPVRTVRVDPAACTAPSADPAVTVVCTVDQVAAHLIDRTAVVLSGTRHRGPLDLRGRTGLRVQGEPGAVLDAAGARFALSLRDVTAATVRDVTLEGGTAQTVWVERTSDVALTRVVVQGSAGSGLQVRDSARFSLTASRVQDAASAGVMELTGVSDSRYADLVVTRNGRGAAAYNGDGLQLSGTRVSVRDVVATENGSSALYEHGVYVSAAARGVVLAGVRSSGNAGVALKLGGSGTLEGSALVDDRIALYCGPTDGAGWSVRTTSLTAPRRSVAEKGCVLSL